jgi:hypothetical protein
MKKNQAVRTLGTITSALILLTLLALPALAQSDRFDQSAYDALAPAEPGQTIPLGTTITPGNWKQYKAFLPVGIQALYSGRYHWKIPDSPDFRIVVGPTIHYPLPHKVLQDTEQYHSQVKLVPVGDGAYNVEGYVAGVPFPVISGPQAGEQVLYNMYYVYQPWVLIDDYDEVLVDTHYNKFKQQTLEIQYRLAHVSEPNLPVVNPRSTGYYTSIFNEVLAPEQSRYTAELQLTLDDPNKLQELYVFLPSLRRSIRLSSAARCSPLLGSDYVVDDNRTFTGLPRLFTSRLLGKKRILALVHQDPIKRNDISNYTDDANLFGWPKPVLGKWELRDVYIIDLRPVPSYSSYCYGSKVIYVDAETFATIGAEQYDTGLKYWKILLQAYRADYNNDGFGGVVLLGGDSIGNMLDIQNNHLSFAYTTSGVRVNSAVPAQYQDLSLYASPGGLAQVMK